MPEKKHYGEKMWFTKTVPLTASEAKTVQALSPVLPKSVTLPATFIQALGLVEALQRLFVMCNKARGWREGLVHAHHALSR